LDLDKSADWEHDALLIKSVMHLAKTDVPSFRHITRRAQAEKIVENVAKVNQLAKQQGFKNLVQEQTADELIAQAVTEKIASNVQKINSVMKSLTAGYGGAGAPTNATGGAVLQSESLDMGRGFKYISCDDCGEENIYMKHQTKCRKCHKSYPFYKLAKLLSSKN
jgi:hypothetical protein